LSRSKVAVLKTSPEGVIADYGRAMRLADYQSYLPPENETGLKINISWHVYFPACSTTPYQLDGVINTMLEDGYDPRLIHGCHNSTVVVNSKVGEVNNHQKQVVVDKYGLNNIHLEEEEWVDFTPKGELLVLNDVYPEGFQIPKRFIGENIIHLPTMKTHVFTEMTGAMKNAFGGLLNQRRHWTHSVIHETLVDLLMIQKEIHPGLFAVMDGTVAGDGPGPRCMVPHETDYVLASSDMVAIDAVSAHMMGIDPMSLDFIRIAHERGLGCGRFEEIEIVGDDVEKVSFGFRSKKNTLASRGQKMIYHGALKPLEHLLLRTWLVPWSYVASRFYHDVLWYPLVGKSRVRQVLNGKWGQLFNSYATQQRVDSSGSV
jgi:uncharacterized protein (DUF362 family)